jgi:hypothetical protein
LTRRNAVDRNNIHTIPIAQRNIVLRGEDAVRNRAAMSTIRPTQPATFTTRRLPMLRRVLVGLLFSFTLAGSASAQSCGPLPNTLTNGQAADASQVMGNFNTLLNCVNNPAAPIQASTGFRNLLIVRPSATGITISADAAVLEDTNGNTVKFRSVSATIDYSTSGAVNKLDIGARTASTVYYNWLISNGTSVASLASLSSTSPTMPTGYTFKLRVGASITDPSNNLINVIQRGRQAEYSAPRSVASSTASWSPVSLALFVPATAIKGDFYFVANNNTVQVGDAAGNVIGLLAGVPVQTFSFFSLYFGQGYNMYYSSTSSGGAANIIGWEDNL